MTIQVDSRGYRYIGGVQTPATSSEVFGTGLAGGGIGYIDSSDNPTSPIYTAHIAVHGPGTLGIRGSLSSGVMSLGNGLIAGVQLSTVASGKAAISANSFSPPVDSTDVPTSQSDFGLTLAGLGSGTTADWIGCFPGSARVDNHGSLGRPATSALTNLWWSTGPSHWAYFAKNPSTEDYWFVYVGVLQNSVLALTDDSLMFGHCGRLQSASTGNPRSFRAISSGTTANILMNDTLGFNPGTIANTGNTTGDPYLTRAYFYDASGTEAGFSRGAAPDLYIYHDANALAIGAGIRCEDLTVPGAYDDSGNLDGSDFQNLVKVGTLGADSLMMRVGD